MYNYFILLLILSFSAIASEKERFRIVTEEWRPYNYTNELGEIEGLATEKVKRIMAALNIEYSMHSYPWTRLMHVASSQPNTIIFSIFRTPERENRFQWACPLTGPVKAYLYKLKKRQDLQLDKLEQAKKYTIALNRADSVHEILLQQGFEDGKHLELSSEQGASIRKLYSGRVDFIVGSQWQIGESVKAQGFAFDEMERLLPITSLSNYDTCMAFSLSTDKQLVEKIQKALKEDNQRFGLP
jgi:polar amino acid transport system substrate-binding protein